MKKLFFSVLLIFLIMRITAQEEDPLNWDIDSVFDEPLPESAEEEAGVLSEVNQRGVTFGASFEFRGILAPGWDTVPWFFDGTEVYSWGPGFRMYSAFSLDAQITDVFRVLTVLSFTIPNFNFTLEEFFFDYNFLNAAFIRAGKYEQSWGISPNFGFTNLLSRVPENVPDDKEYGASYIFKADIPIGVGGIQALGLTRARLMDGVIPEGKDLGYGGKYNLALRWVDFDLGVFYQENTALRSFLSIKTTLWNTELYNEWLLAVNVHTDNAASFAVNLGFAKNFFGEKFTINGELFYNGEKDAVFYRPETNLLEEDPAVPFIENFNMAFNLLYRFSAKANPRIFAQVLYAPFESSAQVIPGFRITPLSNIDIYLAVPMALGEKTGYYYDNTADYFNRPFSIILLVTLKGSVRAGYYY